MSTLPPQHTWQKAGAELMLGMLDLLEIAPAGASIIAGGLYIKKDHTVTAEQIAAKRKALIDIINAPDAPSIWFDRTARRV